MKLPLARFLRYLALAAFAASPALAAPVRALLITGGCCHDYTLQAKALTEGVGAGKWLGSIHSSFPHSEKILAAFLLTAVSSQLKQGAGRDRPTPYFTTRLMS